MHGIIFFLSTLKEIATEARIEPEENLPQISWINTD
jgi:hypothetical protein